MEQSGKKNAERYCVILKNGETATVWAENYQDVLNELAESAELDGIVVRDEDVRMIMQLD